MRIAIASDLHIEVWKTWSGATWTAPPIDADVLVLAGDIDKSRYAVHRPMSMLQEVLDIVQIAGNHEHYGNDIMMSLAAMRRDSSEFPRHRFLERSTAIVGGVRFLGCTLWTDYAIMGSVPFGMGFAESSLNDHRRISLLCRMFSPADALIMHVRSLMWLDYELSIPHDGPTVVVTHHGPSRKSIHPRYDGDHLNAAFNSDLEPLILRHGPELWIHGHVHDPHDYMVGGTRVVVNPRGYPGENYGDEQFHPLVVEV